MVSIGPGLALGSVSGVLDTLLVRRSRSIAGIFPDAVIEENHVDEIEITSHPIEMGADISDHAFKRASEVVMRIGFSPSRPIGLNSGIISDVVGRVTDLTGRSYLQDAYDQLLDLQLALEPFEVITGKRAYQNMLLTSLTVTTDRDSENALFVEARFREVLLVQTQSALLPPVANQALPQQTAAPADTGTKQPQAANQSVLYQGAQAIQNIFSGGAP